MVMIPKAQVGKWRLIAMLVTPYRIWARGAGEDVSRWMASLDREWVANGPAKAAEAAAYDIALDTEASQLDGEMVNVTVMADLEKGFERVRHDVIRKKAKVYGFPERILEPALSMYKAARRIRYGSAYSRAVYTKVGVLAGCPIAMGLLLLAVLEPVDLFWKTVPRELVSLKVYVDDFALSFAFKSTRRLTTS